MIGNALALLGLLAVAIPILIHLLGRHESRVERFPTLRFIGTSRLNPTKRRRISDWPLLLVRMAIVAVAAIALSQPWFGRQAMQSGPLSRVIIQDTSASVARLTELPDTLTTDVVAHRVLTDSPSDAVSDAVRWLSTRAGHRELLILSDFQRSSIDSVAIAAIPADIGVMPIVLPRARAAADTRSLGIGVIAAPADLAGANAAWRAVGLQRPSDTTGRIAIIYRNAIASRRSVPVDSPWMARLIAQVQRDPSLVAASNSATPVRVSGADDTVAVNAAGQPVITAGREGSKLAFFVHDDAGSLTSAALNQALARSLAPIRGAEADTSAWSAAQLARWQREATPVTLGSSGASDARWFWAGCLLLLALETWMRARTRHGAEEAVTDPVVREDRAA